ncbi:SDR family NAD(P)-dependent oxidoreductase [Streptomyces sp. NPDC058335]|uniref:SDR family NAD(P)-dependent oxidoreductase n=1 Tax=Streptomyces sp. NPDC058335 TaxID=3346451 RepID=UPI003656E245
MTGRKARAGGLPTYAFQRERYWLESGSADAVGQGPMPGEHPFLHAAVTVAGTQDVLCTAQLTRAGMPWLADHTVAGRTVLPESALVDALTHIGDAHGVPAIAELTVSTPILMPDDGALDLQIHVGGPDGAGCRAVTVHTRPGPGEDWSEQATGVLAPWPAEPSPATPWQVPDTARPVAGADTDPQGALPYGSGSQAVEAVWLSADGTRAYSEIRLPEADGDDTGYVLHPTLLDALSHVAATLLESGGPRRVVRPADWAGVRIHASGASYLRTTVTALGADAFAVEAVDEYGDALLAIDRLTLRPVDVEALGTASGRPDSLFVTDWLPSDADRSAVPDDAWAYDTDLGDGPPPRAVVHLADREDPALPLPERVHRGARRALERVQRWVGDPATGDSRLVVVVRADDLAHQPLRGLLRTAQSEYEGGFALLEVDDDADTTVRAGLAAVVADEPEAAVREGRVLVPRLRRAETPEQPTSPRLAGGTVLVTGASGGLGRQISRHLVEHHRVGQLVLVSRSGIEQEWAEELRRAGADVTVVAGDMADRETAARVVGSVADRLTAVVHTAGVVDDALLVNLRPEQLSNVLRPKVDAAWHLHELTAGLDLEAFVLFSSASSTFGGAGQANYGAGNSFLDALAGHRHALGLPALSLAWGLWAESRGMGGRLTAADLARTARAGTLALGTEQGLTLFDASLTTGRPVLVPVRLDLDRIRAGGSVPPLFRSLVPVPTRRSARAASAERGTSPSLALRLAAMPAAERDKTLLELVRTSSAAVLGHTANQNVPADRAFKELGFDSLTAVELRNRLTAATGIELPPTLVFNHPTPRALAGHLRTELLGETEPSGPAPDAVRAAPADEPIAIVAMSCRYPGGVESPEDLWRLLASGGDAIGDLPSDRGWDLDALYDPDPDTPGTSYVRKGGFLDSVAEFDAGFFGINPREALAMDPQQRLLLETAWELLERGGMAPGDLRGTRTGVFTGTHGQDYGNRVRGDQVDEGYLVTGNIASVLSGRLSYVLGLEGPALTVDTACSSSLVAIHLAAQALRSGECTLALAGGVSVLSTTEPLIGFSRQRGLAEDGRCKAFGAGADGFGISEGVGLVLLERLSDAERNGHEVLAVVRGSAVNQDGASNGLTAPNGPSQERVITQALAHARLTPGDVDAVEAHGTGTPLGDPIEAHALLATYGADRAGEPLWLGSVKSNIGHTQAAAGVAGVIKMVMAMRHAELPRTLHADEPTPEVDWSAGEVRLVTEPRPWPRTGRARRAGVSSFGVSGTNAHVIVEQAPAVRQPEDTGPADRTPVTPAVVPWILSGHSARALTGQAERLAAHTTAEPAPDAADIAFSLATTRTPQQYRAVVLASGTQQGTTATARFAAGDTVAEVITGRADVDGGTVFVFPGQGSQWLGMGAELLDTAPVFARRIEECAAALAPYTDWSLVDVLRQAEGAPSLDRVDVVQPVSFAMMVSLAALWQSYGVRPDAVMGHSQGEIAAACVAGALSLQDAARVVALRSRVIGRRLAGLGGMMSVQLPADELAARVDGLADRLEIAVVNGPASTVVAGDPGALDELHAALTAQDVRARKVPVDYASHTSHVERIEAELAEVLAGLEPRPATVPFYSTVDDGWIKDTTLLDAGYWYRNLRQTVRFADGTLALAGQGHRVFLEISPHPVLTMSVQETLDAADIGPCAVTGTLRRGEGGPDRFLSALSQVYVRGVHIDWRTWFDGTGARRVPLPTYAFQHHRYWLEATAATGDLTSAGASAADHPLLGAIVELPEDGGVLFTGRLSRSSHPWLTDHQVSGVVLVPGAALVEQVIRAGDEVGCGHLEELVVEAPLVLPEDGGTLLRVAVRPPAGDGNRQVSVHSRSEHAEPDAPWTRHLTGTLSAHESTPGPFPHTWPPADAEAVPLDDYHRTRAGTGYEFGPAFQGLKAVWRHGEEVYAEAELPENLRQDAGRYGLHPALLDAALQAAGFTNAATADPDGSGEAPLLLPFAWNGVGLHATGATALRVRAVPAASGGVALELADQSANPVATIESFVLRATSADRLAEAGTTPSDSMFRIDWTPTAQTVPTGPAAATDVLDLTEAGDGTGAARARALTARALDEVTAWLAEPRADDTGDTAESRLVVLTTGAAPAEGSAAEPDPAAQAVWGLLRSAQTEHPGRIVLVDVDGTRESARAVPAAVATATASGEPQLAVRAGGTYVPRLVRATTEGTDIPVLDPESTVLITGGTGLLGGLVARRLVTEHGVRHLVLAGRRGPDAPGSAALRADLTALGATVTIEACDAANREELAAVLARVPAAHPLRGVVHTAGVLDDGVLTALTAERLDTVFAPKADAAWHLHELTAGLDLDLFVLFSSGASVFGTAGQGNYAAANGFLNGLAQLRRDQGLPALSLAWGLWEQASAMTGHLDDTDLRRSRRGGTRTLGSEEGIALFDAALRLHEPLLVPTRLDLAAVRREAADGNVPALLRALVRPARKAAARAGEAGAASFADRLARLPEADRAKAVADLVRGSAAAVLGHEGAGSIDASQAFKEVGFDSLTAVELRNRLTEATGLRLPATMVFDHPTPAALAVHLQERLLAGSAPAVPPVLAELERLGRSLTAAAGDTELHEQVSAHLQRLSAVWAETVNSPGPEAEFDIEGASDDEIFDLLDSEFGSTS